MSKHAVLFSLYLTLAFAKELDPASCSTRFDVQMDKIIRTEESREMGARYLSELDVGSKEECLRLCCETDSCDVFVYEEKSLGSCYLFNCGPPEDFRCKFTNHGNFSSGVLAISRRLAELQDQEQLTRHEEELVKLRSISTSTLRTTTVTVTPKPPPVHTPRPVKTPQRRCNRYQFECHTSLECIAVYNACDGIPQCADGSDEAPELGCPTSPPLLLTTTTVATVKAKIEETPRDMVSDRLPTEDRWPHRLTQAQPARQYSESAPSSHIFSHKGGLLQDPQSNDISNKMSPYQGYEAPWPRRQWKQPAPGIEGMSSWGNSQGAPPYARYPEWSNSDPRRAWPVPQPRPEMDIPEFPKTMPEVPSEYNNQHSLHDSPKKGFEVIKQLPQPTESVVKAEPATEKVQVSNSMKKELKIEKPVQEKTSSTEETKKPDMVHEHFTQMDDHEGLSEPPPAAVLLLILGILMTTIMGVMIACRARIGHRRLRRGKSLAHDADYLVNGMYL